METICDVCKKPLESLKQWTSKSYKNSEVAICDECLEKHKWEIHLTDSQNIDKVLESVPPLYRNARLKDSPIEFRGKESLYLWSIEPGTGKTHIAWAFYINELLKCDTNLGKNPKPLFTTFGGLQLRLRAAMNEKEETEQAIIDDFSTRHFVVLDDLGGLRNAGASDYTLSMIFEILNNRYSWQKQTIITSNKSLQDIANTFDARIASRLNAMCRIIELTGEDRRLNNGK